MDLLSILDEEMLSLVIYNLSYSEKLYLSITCKQLYQNLDIFLKDISTLFVEVDILSIKEDVIDLC